MTESESQQLARALAKMTAKKSGANDQQASAAGTAAAALTAVPHAKHPCPIADAWYDASLHYAQQYGFDSFVSYANWDSYACSEKRQIMLGSTVGIYGAAYAVVAIAVERASAHSLNEIERAADQLAARLPKLW